MPRSFNKIVASLPEKLASLLEIKINNLYEQVSLRELLQGLSDKQARECSRTLIASDFFERQLSVSATAFFRFLEQGLMEQAIDQEQYHSLLAAQLGACVNQEQLEKSVRIFRNLHMMRIAWRDANQKTSLPESMKELSALADACVQQAYIKLYEWESQEKGIPRSEQGEQQQLCVLGMGKLGAQELNFSSDIDLIFCYPESGYTDSDGQTANQDFFNRLGKKLINTLSRRTQEGFVFRVDMRLRPLGSAGSLSLSFNAMENYYEEQGREWERYAMIKARPVAGDINQGFELLRRIKPFVYRRYIDFGVLESLREMKGLINREVRRKSNEHNIKLGEGGIREIEFIVQALQLISGGRNLELQEPGLLVVLPLLLERSLLEESAARNLEESYCFLRTLEHQLQAIDDAQTQELPDNEDVGMRIAFLSGYENWQDYHDEIDRQRERVRAFFTEFISAEEKGVVELEKNEKKDWLKSFDEQGSGALSEYGFYSNKEVCNFIEGFTRITVIKKLTGIARDRLNQLLPQVLASIDEAQNPLVVTKKLLALVEQVVRRSVYLALLLENRQAYDKMLDLMQLSDLVSIWMTEHPALLEELTVDHPLQLDKAFLADQLQQQLLRIPEDDVEQQMECLRHFQKSHQLRCASEELHKSLKVEFASEYLSNLAEILLQEAYNMAFYHVTHSYGLSSSQILDANFAIIAYGKMGGAELSYGSDLDLVFLHHSEADGDSIEKEAGIERGKFYARLGQRLIHIMSIRTLSGQLYEIDARLRPSGASGMLVSSMDAFEQYQQEKAWLWEHQALVRARWLCGDIDGRRRFEEIRARILCQPRDAEDLKQEVKNMRAKMLEHLGSPQGPDTKAGCSNGLFDLKYDDGGIVDIEFMVQYAVLRWASSFPALIRETSTLRLLDKLAEIIPEFHEIAAPLQDAYRAYREAVHLRALNKQKPQVSQKEFVEMRQQVTSIWGLLLS